jgi:hypothetical protein
MEKKDRIKLIKNLIKNKKHQSIIFKKINKFLKANKIFLFQIGYDYDDLLQMIAINVYETIEKYKNKPQINNSDELYKLIYTRIDWLFKDILKQKHNKSLLPLIANHCDIEKDI